MRGSSKPERSVNSERSVSEILLVEPDVPLCQFSTMSPQMKMALMTVVTIRTRRDRNAANNLFALVGCSVFLSRGDLDVDPVGFAGKGSLVGAVFKLEDFVASGPAASSIATKVIGSVVRASSGSATTEIEDNTAAEHHSGSISNFGDDLDTASSRKTRMSLREIGRRTGKL